MAAGVKILVPGDEPTQIGGSPQLERLEPYGEVALYDTRPQSDEEKLAEEPPDPSGSEPPADPGGSGGRSVCGDLFGGEWSCH